MDSLALIAITRKTATIDDLECVALDPAENAELARRMTAFAGTDEAVIVSTCNRTEIYLAGTEPDVVACAALVAENSGVSLKHLERIAVTFSDDEASRHLFSVAAGLESRLIGEREILGQIRSAIGSAKEDGAAGPILENLFRYAVAAGRRARRAVGTEVAPSLATVSLDAVSVKGDARAVVVGAGEVAAALTDELKLRQIAYDVVARRIAQAERLANGFGEAHGLEHLDARVEGADIVFAATGARTHILTADALAKVMARRRGRPLTVVDLGLPRNVDPEARQISGVRLMDLADLGGGEAGRLPAQVDAIEIEHDRYRTWLAGQAGANLIAKLRQHVYEVCLSEVSAAGDELGIGPVESRKLAQRMSGKLLHAPTLALKEHLLSGREAAARDLLAAFGVDLLDDADLELVGLPEAS